MTLDATMVSALEALDYGNVPVGTLSYAQVEVSGEDDAHKWAVLSSIRLKGVQRPALVLARTGARAMVLIEGHHRAVAALDCGLDLPVEIHHCACPEASLRDFGLCDTILRACARQKEEKENHG